MVKMNLCNVCVLGDARVGKSSSILLFMYNVYEEDSFSSVEDSYRKQISVDDEACFLDIQDTCSQEQYSVLRDPLFSKDGYVFMYSITCRKSFDCISKYFLDIRGRSGEFTPAVLVGNKCDLEKGRQVSNEEGEELAKTLNCPFFETSAKQGIHVTDAFHQLVREIRNPRPSQNNTHLRK